MVERLASLIIGQMEKEKLMEQRREEEYVYAFVTITEKWITVASVMGISFMFKQFIPEVLFLMFFLALRKRTGGYHAEKFWQCYLETLTTCVVIICICPTLVTHMSIIYVLLVCSIILIGVIGSVNHPNMAMDVLELAESKKAARCMVVLECMILFIAIIINVI